MNFQDCFQAAEVVPAHEDQTLTYSIRALLPFTLYRAAVACRGDSNIWSKWSSEVTVRTPDMSNYAFSSRTGSWVSQGGEGPLTSSNLLHFTVPARPVDVCYTVEKAESGGSFLLRLRWQVGI